MAFRRCCNEVREALLNGMRVQDNGPRFIGLHRASLGRNADRPVLSRADNVLLPQLRQLADARARIGAKPRNPPLGRKGLRPLVAAPQTRGGGKDRARLLIGEPFDRSLADLPRLRVTPIAGLAGNPKVRNSPTENRPRPARSLSLTVFAEIGLPCGVDRRKAMVLEAKDVSGGHPRGVIMAQEARKRGHRVPIALVSARLAIGARSLLSTNPRQGR